MNLNLLDPGPDVVETRSVGNVVHQNNAMSISIICLGDVSVSFLASSIPLFEKERPVNFSSTLTQQQRYLPLGL